MNKIWHTLDHTKNLSLQVLQLFGWYPGRKVDISAIVEQYRKQNCFMNEAAKAFMEEFYGIDSIWFFRVRDKEGRYREGGKDFYFEVACRWPEVFRERLPAEVQEKATPVGLFGFHNPGNLWVSEDGMLYIVYEYDDEHIFSYRTVFDFLNEWIAFDSEEVAVCVKIEGI